VDVRDLTAFAVVARQQSFARAALQLRVAQSALSRRVQRLERVLGLSLFERHVRGVRLTEAGTLLLDRADKLVGELAEIEAEMKRLHQPSADELRLALPHGATKLFGSGFLQRYQRLRPHTKLRILEQSSAANRRTVLEGGVDAAMAYEPEQSPELSIEPLLREQLVVVGPARSATGQPIDYPDSYQPADLARLPLLLPLAPHGYRRIVERVTQPLRIEPNVVLEVEGLPALATLVEEGMGMMVSTLAAVETSLAAGRLRAVPLAASRCEVQLSLIHRRDRAMSPALLTLKKVIARAVKDLASCGKCRTARA
jgi:LysR family nitrogen assimilation transcriptional regulator